MTTIPGEAARGHREEAKHGELAEHLMAAVCGLGIDNLLDAGHCDTLL